RSKVSSYRRCHPPSVEALALGRSARSSAASAPRSRTGVTALWRTTGATWPRKIADAGSNAALRLCEPRQERGNMSRFLLREYRLHTGGLAFATWLFAERPALSLV